MTSKKSTKLRVLAVAGVALALVGCRGGDDDDAGSVAESTAEDTGQATAEDTAEDTGEMTAEDTSEMTAEDTSEMTAEDTGEMTAEDTSEMTGDAMAPAAECPASEPGLTDTEIFLGGSYPLSGPAAAYASIPVGVDTWFQYLNDTQGGITAGDGVTRKINWSYLDDGYSPPKALENVRKLIEQDGVWAVLNPLGTPNNAAIREYMNESEVPQLFVATGAAMWGRDIEEYPWTIGLQPDYESEGIAYAQYILGENPDATIGLLYANDDFGKDYQTGIHEGLGDSIDQLISEVTYETTDATVDAQVSQVLGNDPDAFILIATPQFAIQGINQVQALGYEGIKVVTSVSSSVGAVINNVNPDAANDWVTTVYLKDPTDPAFDDDEAVQQYKDLMAQYHPDANVDDGLYLYGMNLAQSFQWTLEHTPVVCRAGIMESAKHLDREDPPLLLDGITLKTDVPGDGFPIQQVQLQRWTGTQYEKFGDIIDAADL